MFVVVVMFLTKELSFRVVLQLRSTKDTVICYAWTLRYETIFLFLLFQQLHKLTTYYWLIKIDRINISWVMTKYYKMYYEIYDLN